jgi:hypothetical protein
VDEELELSEEVGNLRFFSGEEFDFFLGEDFCGEPLTRLEVEACDDFDSSFDVSDVFSPFLCLAYISSAAC